MTRRAKTPLQDQAFRRLRKRLTDGRLAPGTMLSERELARELGMSKTPVRSAVARLAAEGIVVISPQRGIIIRAMSPAEIADGFELRRILEPYIMQRLAGRLEPTTLAGLQKNLDAQQRAIATRRFGQFARLDTRMHVILARATGNHEISAVITRLREKIARSIREVIRRDPSRPQHGYEEHKRIVAALREGRGRTAAKLMSEHLDNGLAAFAPGGPDAVDPSIAENLPGEWR